jgi:hypothetical protein
MKTGIELITEEREKQISKHGFTGEHHALNSEKWYDNNQIQFAVMYLLDENFIFGEEAFPLNWNKEWFMNLNNRDIKERLIISGALIAAELDRLNYLESTNKETLK